MTEHPSGPQGPAQSTFFSLSAGPVARAAFVVAVVAGLIGNGVRTYQVRNELGAMEDEIRTDLGAMQAETFSQIATAREQLGRDITRLENIATYIAMPAVRHALTYPHLDPAYYEQLGVKPDGIALRIESAQLVAAAYAAREGAVPGALEYTDANRALAVALRNYVYVVHWTNSVSDVAAEHPRDAYNVLLNYVNNATTHSGQGMAMVYHIACNAMDIPVRQIGMTNRPHPPHWTHNTTEVMVDGTHWEAQDATFAEAYTDGAGRYLGYAELRERLKAGQPVHTTTDGLAQFRGGSTQDFYASLIGSPWGINYTDGEPYTPYKPGDVPTMVAHAMEYMQVFGPAPWDNAGGIYHNGTYLPTGWDGEIHSDPDAGADSLSAASSAWHEFYAPQ